MYNLHYITGAPCGGTYSYKVFVFFFIISFTSIYLNLSCGGFSAVFRCLNHLDCHPLPIFLQDKPACRLPDPRLEGKTCVYCNHPHSRWKHPSQSGLPAATQPPCELPRAQSEQPVRGPVSCGMSDRITQNSQCIPKAGPCWECTLLSEACLLESLIFHPAFSLFLFPSRFCFSPSWLLFSAARWRVFLWWAHLWLFCFFGLSCEVSSLFLGHPAGSRASFSRSE